jgi:hypothetical protein
MCSVSRCVCVYRRLWHLLEICAVVIVFLSDSEAVADFGWACGELLNALSSCDPSVGCGGVDH